MSNPFDDSIDKPSYPNAAFTNHNSPRRYKPDDIEEDEDFLAFPQSNSPTRSPDIFTRSGRINGNLNRALDNPPNLQPTPSLQPTNNGSPIMMSGTTARAQFTSRESPKRQRQTEIDIDDKDIEPINLPPNPFSSSQGSYKSGRSERFLEPPQPIFSPETYAEANPYEENDSENSTVYDDYDYKAYENQDKETRSLYSDSTAYRSSEDGSSTGVAQSYFGASIDSDMMHNIKNGFQPNREKTITKRKVKLVDGQAGHLVLENPVPEELRKVLTRTESPFGEFTNMTYTACTSEPDDFVKDGFSLRAQKYNRETELVICVTMYNEDEHAFTRTMHAIMKNISHLCSRNKSSVWGKDSWKKIQVVIVADGRNKVNDSVLELLTATGVYQGNLARPYVNNKKVNAHIFEYTTQISIDENLKFKGDEKNLAPAQVIFCLKETNQKKINSHRWLFNAFCPILDPNVIVLLDVGTKPDNHAVYNLWKAFDRDSNVAGAAGEIKAMKGKGWINLTNPLVASQNFEYKMSNILDKPLESLFGYISVLPGALSAYRYIALTNHADGTGPLASYFKGEDILNTTKAHSNTKTNFFEANMYLAEDRILCWELVAKRNENWVLKFVKNATAETDVPETVPEFLSQRRRWINGAFFAALYSLSKSRQIWYTDHSFSRKFWLHVEFMYQSINLVFSFFSLSNFYLTFYFLTGSLVDMIKHNGGFWIFTIFNYLCICVLCSLFIVSIGNRPQGSKTIFKTLMILLTVCGCYALIVGIFFVVNTIKQFSLGGSSSYIMIGTVVSLLSTYGLYTVMSILYLDPWHMLTCSMQYFLMVPSYTCTLQIFAFCNTHDVSWGTKGDNNPKEDLSNQYIIEKNDEGEFEAVVLEVNVDEVYLEALYNIRAKRSNKKVMSTNSGPPVIDGEDYAKDVRTKVVLTWLICNLVFVLTMLQVYEPGETKKNIYLAFILWTVAFLAFIRAIGSLGYLFQTSARFFVETKSKWIHKREGYNSPNANPLN